MIKNRTSHWLVIEESKNNTIFEGSPRSKMSTINFDWKVLDVLKYQINNNNNRRISAVLFEEVNSIRNGKHEGCAF